MTNRAMNFYAGPATLPLAALERARDELVDFDGTGMSIMEHSHRGPSYDAVHSEALSLVRELLEVPDTHRVLFLQGGARHQFAMVPLNLLRDGQSADYVDTGSWSAKALGEAKLVGEARLAASTKVDGVYTRIPTQSDLDLDPKAAYCHITSNNTLFGTQWHDYPDTGDVPLVADMTSDLLCRPIDVSKFGVIFAGAQKNLGPAGVTVVIIREDLVEGGRTDIPQVLRYKSFADKDSLWNTPPTFAIYMLRNTLAVAKERGGARAMRAAANERSSMLYDVMDAHPDFFRCPVEEESRSIMNVVWRLPTEELEKKFLAEAKERNMVGLKGHRSVGGLRASIYNNCEKAWVEALAGFLDEFRVANG